MERQMDEWMYRCIDRWIDRYIDNIDTYMDIQINRSQEDGQTDMK